MIKITLEDINRKSPYEITLNNGDFDFTTDSGTRYSVSFLVTGGQTPEVNPESWTQLKGSNEKRI